MTISAITKLTSLAHSHQSPGPIDTSLLALQPREVFHHDLTTAHLEESSAWSRLRFPKTNCGTVPGSPGQVLITRHPFV
jgi:hypothetical protein